jgi:calcium binding protein
MPAERHNDDFDQRLWTEIIVDAFGPEEQALSWYYYLAEHLRFPFQARCVAGRATTTLRVGDKVEVRGMPAQDVCDHEMFVNIAWQGRLLAVPLRQLEGIGVDDATEQAIEDWHAWVDRGHEL